MKLKLIVVFLLVGIAGALLAQNYTTGTPHRYVLGIIPVSNGVAIGGTVYVRQIVLINDSSSDVTVTVRDRGTDCGGSGCLLTPSSVTVEAKGVWLMNYDDMVAPNGIQWVASDGTNVTGRIHYRTTLNIQ